MEIIDHKTRIEKIAQDGYEFQFGKYISDGWDLFKKAPGPFIIYTLIVLAISVALGLIPILGTIGSVLIMPALTAGFFIGIYKVDLRAEVATGDFFKSFDFFVQLMLLGIVSSILVIIGSFLLVLPGIWLSVGTTFGALLVVFAKLEFWDAIVVSVKVITKKWFHFFGLLIVIGLINILGVLALGVGLLVTIPLSMAIIYASYKDIVGFSTTDGGPSLEDNLVDEHF